MAGIDGKALAATVEEYNRAVRRDVAFDPGRKDGRSTVGLAVPKSNWAETIEAPANLLLAANLVPAVELAGPGPTEDDISQLWLSPGNNNTPNTLAAVSLLENNAKTAGIGG